MGALLDCPRDLAVPDEGSATTRTILSKALGRACRELPALVRAHAVGPRRDDALAVERVLVSLGRRSPGAFASLLRHPHVSTLHRTLRSGAAENPGALFAELLALIAFDLAWAGTLSSEVTLHQLPRQLVSVAARAVVDLPADLVSATFRDGTMTAEGPGRSETIDLSSLARGTEHPWVRRPYRAVRGDILLALADNNPLSGLEAHPDKKTPNTVDLGEHSEDEWIASIREALSLIETHLPAMSADIDVALQQIVPTGFDSEKHLSCSYQEDLGTIYVSLHPSPLTMAEALIHEVSHNKLNALLEFDRIILNGKGELYASPIRPDPRPLHGVLLAVHAFVPVACLYARMTTGTVPLAPGMRQRIEERLAAVVRSNRAGTEVLRAHARPTSIGAGLLDELSRWERHFRAA